MANDVRIAITGNTADAEAALRRLRAEASRTDGLDKLKGALIGLGPAIVPVAAQLAPIAAGAAAAGVATVAFTAAVIPQVKAIGDAAKAQDKATDALAKYGAGSKQAEQAQRAALDAMNKLPPATRKAAEAFVLAKKDFTDWSNSLSGFTAPVVEHALGVGIALLPKLNGLVQGSSEQFDRLLKILGGAIETPGFDKVSSEFTAFADRTLKHVVDGVVHLTTVLRSGDASGPVQKFMAYAKQTGPEVEQFLKDVAAALGNVLQASAMAGPGLLTVADALAKVVAAIPPDALARLLQVYTAFKLIQVASAGFAVASVRVATMGRAITQMRTAAAAATGVTASLSAAYGTLSTGARLGVAAALVGGLYLGLKHYVDAGSQAKVTTEQWGVSLRELDLGGKGASEAISQISKDLKNIQYDAGGKVVKDDSILGIILGSGKKSSADKDLKNFGKALTELVKEGNATEAAQALKKLNDEGKQVPTKYLKDYHQALADVQTEAELTAASEGIFGAQSLEVQRALDKQTRAAQGLHDAIFALNDANRDALDAEADFQQSLDDATAAIKDHRNALKASSIEQALGTQKGREAYQVLSKIASSAEDASSKILIQTGSQEKANRVLIEAHDHLVSAGQAMGLTRDQAVKLADQLDNIKDPKISVTVAIDSAQQAANTIQRHINQLSKMKATPKVRADLGRSEEELAALKRQIDVLKSKTVYVTLKVGTAGMPADVKNLYGFNHATGGPVGHQPGYAAMGGPRSNLTWVGENGPELANLAPGSSVFPAANSRAMAAAPAPASYGPLAITLMMGSQALGEVMIDPLRRAVWTRGGNVQAVLGNGRRS